IECSICGNTKFVNMHKRKLARCSKCGSLERTRVIGMFIKKYNLVKQNTRVLHIAPEKGIADYLIEISGDNCTFVDLDPERYDNIKNIKKLDLCHDLEAISSESFDLIIHSHVMEHIPCNYTYVLYHLHRIMHANASMVCSIPFLPGFYDCCTSPKLTDEDKVHRFGQHDHVRRFGTTDLQMSLGKLYNLEDEYDMRNYFSEEDLTKYNIPEREWKGYTPSSVLCLKKEDFLLK
ncbi:methyltransferase domain-containing protein, partial [Candidatus Venteria ishoeyi]